MKCSRLAVLGLASILGASAAASGQVIQNVTFDDADFQGWYCNGNQMTFWSEHSGEYIGVPFQDFWGITLSNSENPAVLGNLTRYGGALEISVDVRVFNLINFFEDPIPPGEFPLVLQLSDNSQNPSGPASVYFTGPGLPAIESGWVRYTFTIPDPTSLTLPPGWGGTGDEDPVTFMPVLPDGRTYRSVLESVVDLRLTTFQPGYIYGAIFWEVGFDNLTVRLVDAGGCPADWDGNDAVNSNDISAFITSWLADIAGGTTVADFDGSGATNSNDISAFITAWLDAVQNGC